MDQLTRDGLQVWKLKWANDLSLDALWMAGLVQRINNGVGEPTVLDDENNSMDHEVGCVFRVN